MKQLRENQPKIIGQKIIQSGKVSKYYFIILKKIIYIKLI